MDRMSETTKFWSKVGIGAAIAIMFVSFLVSKHPARFDYSVKRTVTHVGQCVREENSSSKTCAVRLDGDDSIEIDKVLMVGDVVWQHCYVKVEKDTKSMSDWCWHSVDRSKKYGDYNRARSEATEFVKSL